MKEIFEKIKNSVTKLFDNDVDDEKTTIIPIIKPKVEKKETISGLYITREKAIAIADKESNIKRSIYKEARMRGQKYGIVEIYDYYATLVMYDKKYAWYVKVMDGKYGYKEEGEYYTGKLRDKSNIRCLIMAETGEYIFIDPLFDTKKIRMVTDEEYLEYINNIKS